MKWSEFVKAVEEQLDGRDPEILYLESDSGLAEHLNVTWDGECVTIRDDWRSCTSCGQATNGVDGLCANCKSTPPASAPTQGL